MASIDDFPFIPFDKMLEEMEHQEQSIKTQLEEYGLNKRQVEDIMEMVVKLVAMNAIANEDART
jgi:hypothetical protein